MPGGPVLRPRRPGRNDSRAAHSALPTAADATGSASAAPCASRADSLRAACRVPVPERSSIQRRASTALSGSRQPPAGRELHYAHRTASQVRRAGSTSRHHAGCSEKDQARGRAGLAREILDLRPHGPGHRLDDPGAEPGALDGAPSLRPTPSSSTTSSARPSGKPLRRTRTSPGRSG